MYGRLSRADGDLEWCGLSFAYFGVGRGEGRIGWVIMHSDPFVLLCGFVNLNSRDCIYEIKTILRNRTSAKGRCPVAQGGQRGPCRAT